MNGVVLFFVPFVISITTIPLVILTFFRIGIVYSEYYYLCMALLFIAMLFLQTKARSEKARLGFLMSYLWNFFGWVGLISFAIAPFGPM